jgi:Phytanoyl-CoA dioxygenase (PhyH)
MDDLRIASHSYAIRCAGFTRIEGQITGSWLDELRDLSDRALAAAMRVYRVRGKLAHTAFGDAYEACRCLYCWGDAALRLLELDCIHALAAHVLGEFKLWDLSVLSVTPSRGDSDPTPRGFHRDFTPVDSPLARPPYLWCFVCLDDTTAQNGATWVVSGSHHVPNPRVQSPDQLQTLAGPISQQACASAGDLVVLDPTALHSAGQNLTDRPRRLINIGLCGAGSPPLVDHWAVAGPALQPRVSARVRRLMQSNANGLDQTWDALPEGWQTQAVR